MFEDLQEQQDRRKITVLNMEQNFLGKFLYTEIKKNKYNQSEWEEVRRWPAN